MPGWQGRSDNSIFSTFSFPFRHLLTCKLRKEHGTLDQRPFYPKNKVPKKKKWKLEINKEKQKVVIQSVQKKTVKKEPINTDLVVIEVKSENNFVNPHI